MPEYDVVVVGASAGGVEALINMIKEIPQDFPAAILIVHHFPATATSVLPQILQRRGHLPATHPYDGEEIRPGRIYVAPPDLHMTVHRDSIVLSHGPRINGHRPAIDVLFRSAARAYDGGVIGVILSGFRDDGSAGLSSVSRSGGLTIVQDPEDALFDVLPRSALSVVDADHVLSAASIGAFLSEVVQPGAPNYSKEGGKVVANRNINLNSDLRETEIAEQGDTGLEDADMPGRLSGLTCPDCGGALWEVDEGNLLRYRCHVGHGYSSDALITGQADDLETALWTALRTLEEMASLQRRLADKAAEKENAFSEHRFRENALATEKRAETIRKILLKRQPITLESEEGDPAERLAS